MFLKQDKKCALTKQPLSFSSKGVYNTASLDRIDNSKGYDLENVQWVHKDVNFMKGSLTQKYFLKLCKLITKNND